VCQQVAVCKGVVVKAAQRRATGEVCVQELGAPLKGAHADALQPLAAGEVDPPDADAAAKGVVAEGGECGAR